MNKTCVWVVMIAMTFCGSAHCSTPPPIPTWWPDTSTGLMWTGDVVGPWPYNQKHDQAVQLCANLTLGGYTGWRLPTIAEYSAVIEQYAAEIYQSNPDHKRTGVPRPSTDTGQSGQFLELKFGGSQGNGYGLWSSTPAGPGHFLAQGSDAAEPTFTPGFLHSYASTYCVRTMEPELIVAAKAANIAVPVASVTEMNDLPVLIALEKTGDPSRIADIEQQEEAIASRDPHLEMRARDDALYNMALLGRWADAVTGYKLLASQNSNDMLIKSHFVWAKHQEKFAEKMPALVNAEWVALNRADVAVRAMNYVEEEADARLAISIAPDWAEGYERLGIALMNERKWLAAKEAYVAGEKKTKHTSINFKWDIQLANNSAKAYPNG